MTKKQGGSDKYSCIELTLSGKGLSASEKQKAFHLFTKRRIPLSKLACSDYKDSFRLSYYTRSFQIAERLRTSFLKSRADRTQLAVKTLDRHDWFDKWKRDYHMRPLGSRFMIVPAWEKKKFKQGQRIPIYLEPGSAFGSGYHETTRLMVRLLEILGKNPGSFLDIGTGTGILAVVASKLGAEKIIGFDHDKPSASVAEKNFKSNHGRNGRFFCANLKKLKLKERFDVVGANLLSKTLLECKKKIVNQVRSGGTLLVSGIVRQNLPDFRKTFRVSKLRCHQILCGRKWAALLYKKGA